MSEQDEGGWGEIEPTKQALGSVEKVEYEVDEPGAEEVTAPVQEEKEDESTYEVVEEEEVEEVKEEPTEDISELDGIQTKGAEKRILQLVHKQLSHMRYLHYLLVKTN